MAIAYDATAGSTVASAGPLTYAHTVSSGSNRILFVSVKISGTGSVSGVTYAGVAMTQVPTHGFIQQQATISGWLFYILNPTAGANNVVVTSAGSVSQIWASSASYTGVSQIVSGSIKNLINTSNSGASAADPQTLAVTSTQDGCWIVMGCGCNVNYSVDAPATTRNDQSSREMIADSGAPVTPAGLYTMSINKASSSNGYMIVVAFREYIAPIDYPLTVAEKIAIIFGKPAIFSRTRTLVIAVKALVATGVAATFTITRRGWNYGEKVATTFTKGAKPASTFTKQAKPTSTFTKQPKP